MLCAPFAWCLLPYHTRCHRGEGCQAWPVPPTDLFWISLGHQLPVNIWARTNAKIVLDTLEAWRPYLFIHSFIGWVLIALASLELTMLATLASNLLWFSNIWSESDISGTHYHAPLYTWLCVCSCTCVFVYMCIHVHVCSCACLRNCMWNHRQKFGIFLNYSPC